MIRQLLKDYKIDFRETGNEHCRHGWVQIRCPMCYEGDYKFHMGYNYEEDYGFHCYKCGFHYPDKIIAEILEISRKEAKAILRRYLKRDSGSGGPETVTETTLPKLALPSGYQLKTPTTAAYRYLRGRFPHKADQEFISMIKDHRIYYTRPGLERYSGRIIIPTFWAGEAVSFQARDYTDKSRGKYINPNKDEEIRNIKQMVWGMDRCGDSAIVCEGVMDALTIGDGAVHLGGISYSREQVKLLSRFRKLYICFDNEKAASRAARRLAASVGIFTEVALVSINSDDINSATLKEIDWLKSLLKG